MHNKRLIILGGGTVNHIASHFAFVSLQPGEQLPLPSLCAPAYGKTAEILSEICKTQIQDMDVELHLTRMAGGLLETNKDVDEFVRDNVIADKRTKVVFFNTALCDWESGSELGGKNGVRLSTKDCLPNGTIQLTLVPAEKIISKIRKTRKDIFLVGFKHTCGATEDEQYIAGLNLCKTASCNLVLANDVKTCVNMIITPEEARYCVTTDRQKVLNELVRITKLRSHLTFTRSTVVAGDLVPWNSSDVPESLRKVVDYCIAKNAYKPFRGSTVGHFAVKVNDTTFLTSQRKTNFNDLEKIGLVKIVTDGPDTVLAYGAKPSVGGQSQRIVFNDHAGYDCIVHFHCPLKNSPKVEVPVRSQLEVECGSHECGQNTSEGLKQFGNLKAVYLSEHGPNIIFNRNIDPQEVIDFIEDNFELSEKTGGYVSL